MLAVVVAVVLLLGEVNGRLTDDIVPETTTRALGGRIDGVRSMVCVIIRVIPKVSTQHHRPPPSPS